MRYTIDGTSTEEINGYGVWKVRNSDGMDVCTFFGPMSFFAASAACTAFNEDLNEPSGEPETGPDYTRTPDFDDLDKAFL